MHTCLPNVEFIDSKGASGNAAADKLKESDKSGNEPESVAVESKVREEH